MARKPTWAKPIEVAEKPPKSKLTTFRIPIDIEEDLRAAAEEISKETGKKIGYQTLLWKIARQWLDANK